MLDYPRSLQPVVFPAHKILLIATRQIGDVLLVTPLLRSLRRAYSTALIDVLVYDHKGGMLAGNPDYNQLIAIAEHPTFKEYRVLFKQIWRRYDLAISTLTGDRPLAYSWLAAPKRVSLVPPYQWQNHWKRWLVHAWTELDNVSTHTILQNLQLADLLGIPRYYEVIVPTSPNSTQILNKLLPFAWQTQAFAVLHLLPMWHYKRWTLTGWKELAHYLTQQGLRIVLTGGGDEQETAYIQTALAKMPDSVTNLAGQLCFGEVAELIKHCKIYIGPDTAVTHLAAATGVPTVALYGPTNPSKWSPYPVGYACNQNPFLNKGTQQVGNVLLIQGTGDCVPCHQEGCERHKQSDSRCLAELESETVIKAIKTAFTSLCT